MLQICYNKNVSVAKWKELLNNTPFSSPFQTPDFFQYFNSLTGFSAQAIALEKGDILLALAIVTIQKEEGLKGYFSRRGIVYGGPLIHKCTEVEFNFFLTHLVNFCKKKIIYLEIRNAFDYSKFKTNFTSLKWQYLPYINYKLEIRNKSKEVLLNAMPYNRRREIKLTLKENVKIELCAGTEELKEVYQILKSLYSERVKKPLPSFALFEKMLEQSFTKIFIIKHAQKIIGGCFCLHNNEYLYTWYYCGIRNYHPKIFATHIAVWAAIEYAVEHNFKTIDLMGAGLASEDYGVRDYKAKFGGTLVEDGRFIKVLNPFLFYVGKLGLKVLSIIKSK